MNRLSFALIAAIVGLAVPARSQGPKPGTPAFDACAKAHGAGAAAECRELYDNPCTPDAEKFCPGKTPGTPEELDCMRSHNGELAPACTSWAKNRVGNGPCMADSQKFCPGLKDDSRQRYDCMLKNYDDVSPRCRAIMKKSRKARGGTKGGTKGAATNIFGDVEPDDLLRYGLIPELVGRLPVSVPLESLDEDSLVRILKEPKNALTKQYQKLFELEDVTITFEESALKAIATKAISRGTGARGLRAILEEMLLDTMFDLPSRDDVIEVRVTEACVLNKAAPLLELSGKRQKKEA